MPSNAHHSRCGESERSSPDIITRRYEDSHKSSGIIWHKQGGKRGPNLQRAVSVGLRAMMFVCSLMPPWLDESTLSSETGDLVRNATDQQFPLLGRCQSCFLFILLHLLALFYYYMQKSNNTHVTQRLPLLCQQQLVCLLKAGFSICLDWILNYRKLPWCHKRYMYVLQEIRYWGTWSIYYDHFGEAVVYSHIRITFAFCGFNPLYWRRHYAALNKEVTSRQFRGNGRDVVKILSVIEALSSEKLVNMVLIIHTGFVVFSNFPWNRESFYCWIFEAKYLIKLRIFRM